MIDYNSFEKFGKKGYAELVRKINNFYELNGKFPEDLRGFSVTSEDVAVLKHRGKLERKLSKIKEPRLLFLKTFDKKDEKYFSNNNQFIYDKFNYKFRNLEENKGYIELGLSFINQDILDEINKHCLRFVSTNRRILFVRPERSFKQLIIPSSFGFKANNTGTLVNPIYMMEDVLSDRDKILGHLYSQGLRRKNLRKIKALFSEESLDYLRESSKGMLGVDVYDLGFIQKFVLRS